MQKKKNLELYAAETNSPLRVMLFEDKVHAGFPSPVDDFCLKHSIDLNHELIRHPATTFLARVAGDSMIDEGIDEGDLLVIDRSLIPDEMHLTVCCIDGEFAVKRLKISHGELYLMPGNRQYKPIHVTQDKNFMVWGVVTWVIKKKA
jgi:DNA polymerase V